jgi:regulatory protein
MSTIETTHQELLGGNIPLQSEARQGLIYAMRLLSISKRSESDIVARLKRKGYQEDHVVQIIRYLKEKKLLDDVAFAKNFVYWAHHGNAIGSKRIRLQLRKKGVRGDAIEQAMEDHDRVHEKKSAFELAEMRYEKLKMLDPDKRKKRIYDFLVRRGFDYETCRNVVFQLESKR